MDIATLIGLIAGLLCMIVPILQGGYPEAFFDVASIYIVVGGGLASVFISYRMNEISSIMKVVVKAFLGKKDSPEDTIRELVELSQKARREGLLALDMSEENTEEDFLKQSIQLIVDGVEPEVIRDTMDLELENMKARHSKGQGLFKTMASLFPAWGMIGTLVGLIILLKGLDDPSTIGPSMSVALVTTFYGSVLANFVCTPIANKLNIKSQEEVRLKEMIIEGVLSIQAGENPRVMEHKLKTFLSPEQKRQYNEKTQSIAEGSARAVQGSEEFSS